MRTVTLFMPVTVSIFLAGCLEPSPEEVLPFDVFVGDDVDAPAFSELPDFESRVDQFTQRIDYLRGFAEGRPIWYWNVDGANSRVIAPALFIVDESGERRQAPIIDSLPGDLGYSPWWRVIEYQVTSAWNGEVFTSRASVDAGARAGLLEGPVETSEVLNAPVSLPEVTADDGMQISVRTSTVWYRGAVGRWVPFNQDFRLPTGVRQMPTLPKYIFQRIDEALPIYEFIAGVDLNGDNELNDSNNVFAVDVTSDDYTPLWFAASVRTTPDYESIDTSPIDRAVGLSAEAEFFDRGTSRVLSSQVVSVELDEDRLVNCPIQTVVGELR